jgi:hypothetical protein
LVTHVLRSRLDDNSTLPQQDQLEKELPHENSRVAVVQKEVLSYLKWAA